MVGEQGQESQIWSGALAVGALMLASAAASGYNQRAVRDSEANLADFAVFACSPLVARALAMTEAISLFVVSSNRPY